MATTRKTRSSSTGSARRSASQSAAQRTRSTGGNGGNSGNRSSRQDTPERDSQGRFKADHHVRNAAVGAAVTVGAVAAGIAAAFKFGLLDRLLPASEGHSAEDLLIDNPDDDQPALRAGKSRGPGRASPDFRPDMDAPLSKADKDALRPAKGQRAADLAGADNGAVETV